MAKDFNNFNMYAGLLGGAGDRIALRTAKYMRKQAWNHAVSHRDTGAESEGVYVKSWSGYNEAPNAIARAEELNPKVRMLDEVPTPPRGETWVVAETPYDIYQEYGTRKMAAHPFMTPAFFEAVAYFYKEAKTLERELKKGTP